MQTGLTPKAHAENVLEPSFRISNNNKIALEIIHLTKKYINSACYVFSRNFRHVTADDLRQECYLKILSIVKSKEDLAFNELMELCKTSCYNLLKDIYRREKYRRYETYGFEASDGEDEIFNAFELIPNPDNLEDFIEIADALILLDKKINSLDRQILRLLLSPDLELVSLAEKTNKEVLKQREEGKLKMNINQVKITSKLIAQRLSISPATVSRSLKKINLIISELLSDEESVVCY